MAINRSKAKVLAGYPDAVATKVGWVNPKTGELLVSIKGLPGAIDWESRSNTFIKNGKVFDPTKPQKKEKTAGKVEDKPAAVAEPVVDEKPVKKKAAKKKAKSNSEEE